MSVSEYIRIYLAVYGPEIIGGFGLEEKSQKTKAVFGLGRTKYGGLRNERPTIKAKKYGQHFRSAYGAILLHRKLNELLLVLPPRAQLAAQQISVLQVATICCAK